MLGTSAAQAIEIALQHHRRGELPQAEAIYRQVLDQQPSNADALQLLGALAYQVGRYDDAVALISRAIQIAPAMPQSHANLGTALLALGRNDEAIASFERSLRINPKQPDTRAHLGDALMSRGQWEDAAGHYRAALKTRPNDPAAHNNLGHALHAMGLAAQAAEAFEDAIRANGDFAEAHANLGNVLLETGQIPAAIAAYRRSLALRPDLVAVHSNLLYALHFDPQATPQQIYDEHLAWAREFAEPLTAQAPPHANLPDPERKLRIGYVSQDFRDHPVGRFMLPVLANHDRERFEVHCFSDVYLPDELTQQMRGMVDAWHETQRLNDAALAAFCRAHPIDILVDLSGHTAVNRLLAFARKPAPVQVTYLGYPDTTGMTAMDYRITDAIADPPGQSERFYTERLARVSDAFLCYRPPADLPPVAPPPCVARGHVTFGSFNNLAKLSFDVIALWARLLNDIPGSKLVIKSQALGDEASRQRLRKAFAAHDVSPDRLDVRARQPSHAAHLAAYADVDVALDTFPYNGTTTTCEALVMGVPVVTSAGSTHASRVGLSLLTATGLSQWVAATPEDYLRVAIDLAGDPKRLADIRAALRDHVLNSPLGDAPGFTRKLEGLYLDMWEQWCAEQDTSW